MKRYRFRLESVLRIRELQADVARGALALANHEVQLCDRRLLDRRDTYGPAGTPIASDVAAVYLLDVASRARKGLAIVEAHHQLVDARVERDASRERWQEAKRRVSALERLDDRRREEHRLDNQRADEAEMDDVVVSRYGRPSWTA